VRQVQTFYTPLVGTLTYLLQNRGAFRAQVSTTTSCFSALFRSILSLTSLNRCYDATTITPTNVPYEAG
jgi:hypothetical protein